MKALTLQPGVRDSARLDDVPEPAGADVLVAVQATGVCGTDREILAAEYGEAPPGESRLILGHESIGRVVDPGGSGLAAGDWVVAMVRHPDPEPCSSCAAGEWDMCRNGRYTEHGIKGVHGFMRERYRVAADRLVSVDPALGELGVLLEPTSVVAKAWEQIDRIAARAATPARRHVLVTGAGPIGILAALLAVQRGHDVTVLDRNLEGPKPELVRALGARYITGDLVPADVIVECTGAIPVVHAALSTAHPDAIVCLTGVSPRDRVIPIDLGGLNRDLVLANMVVFGSVNANRRHYEAAAEALACADRDWIARLITRRLPLDQWREAVGKQRHDIKTIIAWT
jgi:threonine dehydrogenase-like Zn-dependent dehydrogenase